MLDVCVWKEGRELEGKKGTVVRHGFYEKPSSSPTVFHGRGATSTKSKIITLAEEVKRRLLNMDRSHGKEERIQELKRFSQKMVDSAYGKDTRKEVITSGIKRYSRLVLQELAGVRKVYRSREEMKEGRRLKSLWNRTWYKSRRGGTKVSADLDHPTLERKGKGRGVDVTTSGEKQTKEEKIKVVETPIFIPFTLESRMRKRMQETDDVLGEATNSPSVRFVEREGPTVKETVGCNHPGAKD